MPKQAEAKRDGAMSPQNYNFNKFKTRKFWKIFFYEDIGVEGLSFMHTNMV